MDNMDWYKGDIDSLVVDSETILEPCEHCGCGVRLIMLEGKWVIDDPNCQRHHWESDSGRYKGKDGLVEWWNTRADQEICFIENKFFVDDTDWPHYDWDLDCDHTVTTNDSESPEFCTHCGKKVAGFVGDDA